MFTVVECRIKAAQKLAKAKAEPRNRRKHTASAETWLLLAIRLEEIDVTMFRLQQAILAA